MKPRMTEEEAALFIAFTRKCRSYVEFGTGGSTVIASGHADVVLSVDSSKEWLARVEQSCATNKTTPKLLFADIGPTGDWGFPIDPSTKDRWPNYHSAIWNTVDVAEADLYFVDGRFRVACFAQIVLHCSPTAIIGMHDFASRPAYHCVKEIAREIARVGDLSFFLPVTNKHVAKNMLERFCFDPS